MTDHNHDETPEGRLHPEGAPGAMDGFLRQLLGDARYESTREANQAAQEHAEAMQRETLTRYRLVNGLLTLLVVAGWIAFGFGLIALALLVVIR